MSSGLSAEEQQAVVEQAELEQAAREETGEMERQRVTVAQWGNETTDVVSHFPEERHSDYNIFITMLDKKMGIGFISKSDIEYFRHQFNRAHVEWAHSIRGEYYDGIDQVFVSLIEPIFIMTLSGSVDGKERRLHFTNVKELSMNTVNRAKKGFWSRFGA